MLSIDGRQNDDGAPAPDPTPARRPEFRTLVVDADRFMTTPLELLLAADGQGVLTADSPESALAMTRQFQPNLILLDAGVIGGSHLELLGELLIEQAEAAVVVIARQASIAEAVEAIKMGALDYLERPLDLKRLARLIEEQRAWFVDPSPSERGPA
jgi:DNA-binding NtrC family response regulator